MTVIYCYIYVNWQPRGHRRRESHTSQCLIESDFDVYYQCRDRLRIRGVTTH